MSTIMIKVGGMKCEGCVGAVQERLSQVRGVRTAVVDLASGEANVQIEDGVTDIGKLVEAVKAAGYEATPGNV
ncbi:heavy-metal-associated domain-containing protein [Planctomycetota bacterium]|nr:heavy-metal-associated domain-containing protein [Planctomycetota bacterium]